MSGRVDHADTTKPGRRTVQEYETLKQLVNEIADDMAKAQGGNKAAGTRVRKQMQEIKNLAQDIRKKVLDFRETAEN